MAGCLFGLLACSGCGSGVYPYENIERQFVGADLVSVGRPSSVNRGGARYVPVPARPKVKFVHTGYSVNRVPSGENGVAAGAWRPAERCADAISVTDAKNDTRSWTLPAPPGPAVIPPSADLRRFELRATKAGVCVRWTTAAPAPPGTTLVFLAHGPWFREASGAQVTRGYGFEVELRKDGPRVMFGLARLGSSAPLVLRARVGRTGSVVSAFLRKEWLRRPANMYQWAYLYRAFSFEARVLSVPDSRGIRRVDFYPQERPGPVAIAAYINGHLCAPPCHDPRFTPK